MTGLSHEIRRLIRFRAGGLGSVSIANEKAPRDAGPSVGEWWVLVAGRSIVHPASAWTRLVPTTGLKSGASRRNGRHACRCAGFIHDAAAINRADGDTVAVDRSAR